MWKPAKRVTTMLGYGGSFVRGNTIFLNPLTPSGTLDYNYQRPYASVLIEIYRGFSYKMGWNYYGFNETGNQTHLAWPRYRCRTSTAATRRSRSSTRSKP